MVKAISQDKVKEIVSLRMRGLQMKAIAWEVGVSLPSIGKYLRQHGLTAAKRIGRATHKQRQCLNCEEVQTISVGNKSKVCRPCEDNRKRELWMAGANKENLNAAR